MEKAHDYLSLAECEMTPHGSGTEQGRSGRVQGEGQLERDGNAAFIKGEKPYLSLLRRLALGLDEGSLYVPQNLRHQCFPWIAAGLYWDSWSLFFYKMKGAAQGIILSSWHWPDLWFNPCLS